MSTPAEILSKLNAILESMANTVNAVGPTRLLTLDRATRANAALVYLREGGHERFRWGLAPEDKDFVIQYSPDGTPFTYDDRLRIDSETGKVTVKGLSLDGADFANTRLTGQTRFADGSAAAPAVTREGGTNTGFFFPETDQIAAAVAGSELARITPTGLAIGKDTASYPLDVGGAGRVEVLNIVGTAPVINVADTDNAVTGQIGSGTSDFNIASNVSIDIRPNNVRAGFISNSGWQFFANETEVARFTSAGLGIGTSSVGAAIDIARGTGSTIRFRDAASTHGYQIRSNVNETNDYGLLIEDLTGKDLYLVQGGAAGWHAWSIDGQERMRLNSSGRVGIGTSSPDHDFDVNGTFGVSGAATLGGNIVFSSDDFRLYPTTVDGADTARVALIAGGSFSTSRGGYIYACGNEHSTTPGEVLVAAGNVETAAARISAPNYVSVSTAAGEVLRADAAGSLLIGTTTSGASKLVVNDDSVQVTTPKTPASATDTGETGQIAWDDEHIYVCTAPDTWKRAALTTW
uniref:hypothetical protein n=1 Tax=Stappia sp. TaxID=1870903 RepID=UPI003BAB0CD0